MDRVCGKPGLSIFLGDMVAEDRADGTVGVDDRELKFDRFTGFDGFSAARQEDLHVEGLFQAVVLRDGLMGFGIGRWTFRGFEDGGQVQSIGFPMLDGLIDFKAIGSPDHFIDACES